MSSRGRPAGGAARAEFSGDEQQHRRPHRFSARSLGGPGRPKYCLDWQVFLEAAAAGALVRAPTLLGYRLHGSNTVWFDEVRGTAYALEVNRVIAHALRQRAPTASAAGDDEVAGVLELLANHAAGTRTPAAWQCMRRRSWATGSSSRPATVPRRAPPGAASCPAPAARAVPAHHAPEETTAIAGWALAEVAREDAAAARATELELQSSFGVTNDVSARRSDSSRGERARRLGCVRCRAPACRGGGRARGPLPPRRHDCGRRWKRRLPATPTTWRAHAPRSRPRPAPTPKPPRGRTQPRPRRRRTPRKSPGCASRPSGWSATGYGTAPADRALAGRWCGQRARLRDLRNRWSLATGRAAQPARTGAAPGRRRGVLELPHPLADLRVPGDAGALVGGARLPRVLLRHQSQAPSCRPLSPGCGTSGW